MRISYNRLCEEFDQLCCQAANMKPCNGLLDVHVLDLPTRSARYGSTSLNTLGLRCARFARWPPQARERGSSGKASDTASPG